MHNPSPVLLVDGHVHFYACFEPESLLGAAWHAFDARARKAGIERWRGVLLLTESRRDAVFEELALHATFKGRPLNGWTVTQAPEPESLLLTAPDGRKLAVVSGFQVATREDLEVLAIGTRVRVADGQEFLETFNQVCQSGAFPVVPWGFGKWTLQRGQAIRRLIDSASPTQVAFGDNGGRIAGLPMPRLLKLAASKQFSILPGTDPLPFAEQGGRVGSSGFSLTVQDETTLPAKAIKSALVSRGAAEPYITLTNPLSFALAQVRMQMRKRFG